METHTSVPRRGDIVWVNLNPVRGHEQAGRRPVVIVSSSDFNTKTGHAIIVPITSKRKGYEIEVPVQTKHIDGVALTSSVRAVDWRKRRITRMDTCPEEALRAIQGMLIAFIADGAR